MRPRAASGERWRERERVISRSRSLGAVGPRRPAAPLQRGFRAKTLYSTQNTPLGLFGWKSPVFDTATGKNGQRPLQARG